MGGWVESLEEFRLDLTRWGEALRSPKADWQIYFDKSKEGKIQIYNCYHPVTNKRLTEQSAIDLLCEIFLNYGERAWRMFPRSEAGTGLTYKSAVFWRIIERTEFPKDKPELANIYIKLRINKDFEALGVTLDKFEVVSFHPERDT